ncbi:MAG TPA: hypothetical protein VJ875_19480 [Pyrinomonadaceae bacterium]|nr:hypothetical protein [Pyrinomonadaceae bacterium]
MPSFRQHVQNYGSDAVSVTPRAFTNFSPRVGAQRQPWDRDLEVSQTLKGFGNWRTLSEFHRSDQTTQGSRSRSNHGLEISQRLRRYLSFGANCITTQNYKKLSTITEKYNYVPFPGMIV